MQTQQMIPHEYIVRTDKPTELGDAIALTRIISGYCATIDSVAFPTNEGLSSFAFHLSMPKIMYLELMGTLDRLTYRTLSLAIRLYPELNGIRVVQTLVLDTTEILMENAVYDDEIINVTLLFEGTLSRAESDLVAPDSIYEFECDGVPVSYARALATPLTNLGAQYATPNHIRAAVREV